MTQAATRNLRRMVARADTADGFERLVNWIDAYAERPRAVTLNVQPDGTIAAPEIGWRERIM